MENEDHQNSRFRPEKTPKLNKDLIDVTDNNNSIQVLQSRVKHVEKSILADKGYRKEKNVDSAILYKSHENSFSSLSHRTKTFEKRLTILDSAYAKLAITVS
jgi:hypothetical protein